MYKLLMALIMSYTLLLANTFLTLSNEELFEEPSICEKTYNDCIDECEKAIPSTFTNCLTECSSLYEECKDKMVAKNSKTSKCKDLYMTCTLRCEEKIPQIEQNLCYTDCELSFDKCIDN